MRILSCGLCFCLLSSSSAQEPVFSVSSVLRHDQALDRPHDVELQGRYAFVPGKGGSIAIIDVARPRQPRLIWYDHQPARLFESETVLLAANRLFLGTLDFISIDITDPAGPVYQTRISDLPRISRINGMVRRGNHIFAANKDGYIDVFDVSKPATPCLVAALNVREKWDLGWPHDIDLHGGFLVITDPQKFGTIGKDGKLALIRAFSPDGQTLLPVSEWSLAGVVSSKELTGANRVQVAGDYAFVAGSQAGVPSYFAVVDITNPAEPKQAAALEFSDLYGPNGLNLAGQVAFVAGGQTVEAVDIGNPRQPRKLAARRFPSALPTGRDNAHDLVCRGRFLYVAGQNDNTLMVLYLESDAVYQLTTRPLGTTP